MSPQAASTRTWIHLKPSPSITAAIARYLQTKRALGCRFNTEERALRLFARFLAEQGITHA